MPLPPSPSFPPRSGLITAAGAALGVALFAYAVHRVGLDLLLDGIGRIGWGLVAVLVLAGVRFVVRAQCWRWCLPSHVRLTLLQAFNAFVAGDAVGNVTPLGLLASEPAKVLLTRHHLATDESIASLTLENLLYAASVLAMLALGIGLMLALVPLSDGVRLFTMGIVAGVVVAAVVSLRVLRVAAPAGPSPRLQRLISLRDDVVGFSAHHPGRLAAVFALQLLFHALAIAEVFVTLRWLLGDRMPSLAQAIVFETVNRLTIVLFKFVPFRLGVDEAASGAIAPWLAVPPAAGVTLAVVRKARTLFWSGIGLVLIAMHPSTRLRAVNDEEKTAGI
ncbi:MAG TPA: lysylphosphatidylglycerol synthase domain-containing protein [Vicinamibacterales bacterium]|jgi:hypothetical protein|nr:lysylphosphatidylglycerol synthase domain-containing protein [Vicinamibacterales bacterium]